MKHAIPEEDLGRYADPMTKAVETCVHCGFCLTNCPTYQVLGRETASPRGRIVLMKEVLEGSVPLAQATPHLDECLGCLACETHCPSGVHYRDLISPFRDNTEPDRRRPIIDRIKRAVLVRTLPYPGRFRLAARLGKMGHPFRDIMPSPFRTMLRLLPAHLPAAKPVPAVSTPDSGPRHKVGLLAGCAQQVLAPGINAATIDVLLRHGVEVHCPTEQECCGALAWHIGQGDRARTHAVANLQAFPWNNLDAIITNAAGCGAGLSEYPLILKGTRYEARARQFATKVQDISAYLIELGYQPPPGPDHEISVAYHDACHLSHGQAVRDQPRELLNRIPNVRVVEIPDGEICCGSAGTYNIDQPDTASQLGHRKSNNILSTKADYVVMGNIGCLTQIGLHLGQCGGPTPKIMHTIEFLAAAYAGKL